MAIASALGYGALLIAVSVFAVLKQVSIPYPWRRIGAILAVAVGAYSAGAQMLGDTQLIDLFLRTAWALGTAGLIALVATAKPANVSMLVCPVDTVTSWLVCGASAMTPRAHGEGVTKAKTLPRALPDPRMTRPVLRDLHRGETAAQACERSRLGRLHREPHDIPPYPTLRSCRDLCVAAGPERRGLGEDLHGRAAKKDTSPRSRREHRVQRSVPEGVLECQKCAAR